MNIFRTKDVSLRQTEMHRHLKLWDLILLGIGAMVGTGMVFTIFILKIQATILES